MKKIKILQCCVFNLPNRIGGIEIYVNALSIELKKLGYDIKIIVPDYPDEPSYPSSYNSIPIITYPEFKNTTRGEFKGKLPGKGLAAFLKIINTEQPDLVHFHQISNSNGMSIFHFEEVSKLGIPVVFTIHLNGWERRSLIKKIFQFSDKVILLSDWYYDFLKRKYGIEKKISIIKSGLPFFEKAETIGRSDSKCLHLVYVGRIASEKGLHILLEAIKDIKNNEITLSIYGQVSDDKYYKKCLSLSKNKTNIEWCGFVHNREIANVISKHHFLVLPSIVQEMSPLVVLEAFSVRVPVIGSNTGGISEIVQEGVNGFLFEMNKSKSLKKVIKNILNSPSILEDPSFKFSPVRRFAEIASEVQREYKELLKL